MSLLKVKEYFRVFNMEERVKEFTVSSATVELAAQALSCEPARIAKTLSFHGTYGVFLVVTAGDMKIDNKKFKGSFGVKAKMLSYDEVEPLTGHPVGGVCPFAVDDDVAVFLDVSLRRFETVFPACGSANSAIELTVSDLEKYSRARSFVDVCKPINEN